MPSKRNLPESNEISSSAKVKTQVKLAIEAEKEEYRKFILQHLEVIRPEVNKGLQNVLSKKPVQNAKRVWMELHSDGNWDWGFPMSIGTLSHEDKEEDFHIVPDEPRLVIIKREDDTFLDSLAKKDVDVFNFAGQVFIEFFQECWDALNANEQLRNVKKVGISIHDEPNHYDLRLKQWVKGDIDGEEGDEEEEEEEEEEGEGEEEAAEEEDE